jgi:hypothetical protein
MRDIHGRALRSTPSRAEKYSANRQLECAMLLAGALAAASFAPHPLVLPVVSVVLVASAGLAASLAWMRREGRAQGVFTRWDQAGILAFAGIAAAMTGDSAEVLQFMDSFAEPRLASE